MPPIYETLDNCITSEEQCEQKLGKILCASFLTATGTLLGFSTALLFINSLNLDFNSVSSQAIETAGFILGGSAGLGFSFFALHAKKSPIENEENNESTSLRVV